MSTLSTQPGLHSLLRIPTGFRNKAQGCSPASYPGYIRREPQPQTGLRNHHAAVAWHRTIFNGCDRKFVVLLCSTIVQFRRTLRRIWQAPYHIWHLVFGHLRRSHYGFLLVAAPPRCGFLFSVGDPFVFSSTTSVVAYLLRKTERTDERTLRPTSDSKPET